MHRSIEAAMECLDVTLESELTLFRNRHPHKASQDNEPPSEAMENDSFPRVLSPTPKSKDLVHSVPPSGTSLPNPETLDRPGSQDITTQAAQLLDVSLKDFELTNHQVSSDTQEALPDRQLEELYAPEAYDSDAFDSDAFDSSAFDFNGNEPEDIPSGALVPSKALVPESAFSSSATLETYTDPALDDYLESSEVLLQQLDTPIAKRQLDDSISLKWFGWAAGVTLALSILAAFFLQNMFKVPEERSPQDPNATVRPETDVVQPPPETSPSQPEIKGPDLSEKEFPSVNPGNIGNLPTPEKTEPPAVSVPPPSPTPESPLVTNTNPSGRQFYVVTTYTDEASLISAQKIVPESKVVNFTAGTRIQLKQFSDEAAARTAAAELQKQGLAVEILATQPE